MSVSAALALVLLVGIPAEAVWRSWGKLPPPGKTGRYARAIAKAVVLLALLVVAARAERLTPAALGLGLPFGTAGWIGLTIAMLVTGALVVTTHSRRGECPFPLKAGIRLAPVLRHRFRP